MSKKTILFVGYRGKRGHLESPRKKYELFLLIEKSEFKPEYKKEFGKVFVVDDIFDWKEVHKALEGEKIDAVLTRYEDFVVQVSAIADYYDLPSVQLENAMNFRNKFLMRKAFEKHGAPSAGFALVSNIGDAEEFLKNHDFPLILKQISGIHSKYVSKVKDKKELEKTISHYLDSLKKDPSNLHRDLTDSALDIDVPHPHEHLILEEMLKGQEFSIDAFVIDKKPYFTPICRYVLAEEIGIDDHHLPIRYLPYELTQKQQDVVYETVAEGLAALGADFCTTHSEVFFDPETNECRLLEIAARGGGFRAEMYYAVTGNDYNMATVEAALGIPPSFSQEINKFVAVVEVFANEKGVLKSIDTNVLENREDVSHITFNKKVGEEVGKASSGGSYIVKFLVCDETFEGIKKKAVDLLSEVRASIKVGEVKHPFLIVIPHSTNHLPEKMAEGMKLTEADVERYHDAGAYELFNLDDFHVIAAEYSRLYCDLNRAPDQKAGSTMKDRKGVVINKTYFGKDIYKKPLTESEYADRLEEHKRSFVEIEKCIKENDIQFFIGGHTMYSHPLQEDPTDANKRKDIVLSNNDHQTCDEETINIMKECFEEHGYVVGVNDPFKGGYQLTHFCDKDALPGIQIEFRIANIGDEKTLELDQKKIGVHKEKIRQALLDFWGKVG
jgi:N-formylglutamate amidohydrolase/biotin carboxylase